MGSGSIYRPDKIVKLKLRYRPRTHPEAFASGRQSSVRYHKDVVTARKVDVEQETNEVAVVVLTQAIVHPWTVMI